MNSNTKLPLKKIIITPQDYFRPPPGGGGPKVFGAVTTAVRNRIAADVQSVRAHIQNVFTTNPKLAAVERVMM